MIFQVMACPKQWVLKLALLSCHSQTQAVKMADSLSKRISFPEGSDFALPVGQALPVTEKYQATVSFFMHAI